VTLSLQFLFSDHSNLRITG